VQDNNRNVHNYNEENKCFNGTIYALSLKSRKKTPERNGIKVNYALETEMKIKTAKVANNDLLQDV